MLRQGWASAALIRQFQPQEASPTFPCFTSYSHRRSFPKLQEDFNRQPTYLLETQKKGDLGKENSEGSGVKLPEFKSHLHHLLADLGQGV